MHRVMRIEAVRWVVAQEMAHVTHIQVYVAKHSEGEQRGNIEPMLALNCTALEGGC